MWRSVAAECCAVEIRGRGVPPLPAGYFPASARRARGSAHGSCNTTRWIEKHLDLITFSGHIAYVVLLNAFSFLFSSINENTK